MHPSSGCCAYAVLFQPASAVPHQAQAQLLSAFTCSCQSACCTNWASVLVTLQQSTDMVCALLGNLRLYIDVLCSFAGDLSGLFLIQASRQLDAVAQAMVFSQMSHGQ